MRRKNQEGRSKKHSPKQNFSPHLSVRASTVLKSSSGTSNRGARWKVSSFARSRFALKRKQGPCFERNQAVIYKGPFREVLDDDGHRLRRGTRHAVCDKTLQLYRNSPYHNHFEFVEPLQAIPLEQAKPFDCGRASPRDPKETKGFLYQLTTAASSCCDGGNGAGP